MEKDQIENPSCDQCLRSSVKSNCSDMDQQSIQKRKFSSSEPTTLPQSSLIEYNRIFCSVCNDCRTFPQLISQLQKFGISYNPKYLSEVSQQINSHHIRVQLLKKTKHFQVISMTVSLGPFTQNLSIYNTFSTSIFHKDLLYYGGKSTSIYSFNKNNKFYIAKSISFQSIHNPNSNFKRKEFLTSVREYFITKIMSVLKIGPKLCPQFGFDIFVSEDEVFFFLQLCEPSKRGNFTEQDTLTLKKCLKQMHNLSFLHRDVKTDNIMYSQSYKKYVLIDFGISQFRNQKPGELVNSTFAGTYAYCTQQMKKMFTNRQSSWIDLHFNDAYGLQISVKEMINIQPFDHGFIPHLTFDEEENLKLYDFLTEVRIKFLLYSSQIEKIYEFEQILRFPQEVGNSILNFLYEIPLSEKIRKIYQFFLEEYAKNQKKFKDLIQIFESKIYFQSCRGKRQFTLEELKKIQQFHDFYEKIKVQHNQISKYKKIPIKNLEDVLFNSMRIEELSRQDYERQIIEYLNFKRIDSSILIEQKLEASKFYLRFNQICTQDQLKLLTVEQIFSLVFHNIVLRITSEWEMERFFQYLDALENYLILTQNLDLNVLAQVCKVVNHIHQLEEYSLGQKIQKILLVFLSLGFFRYTFADMNTRNQLNQIENIVKQRVIFYHSQSILTKSSDMKVCQLYHASLNYFSLEYSSQHRCNPNKLLQQINEIKPNTRNSSRLLNYIQYRLLIRIQKIDNAYFQKKQKEQMIIQEMENENEINSLIVHVIIFYYHTKQLKMMKRFLGMFDSAIQLKQISIKYFCYVRIYNIILQQKDEAVNKKEDQIKKICTQLMPLIQVNPSNFSRFILQIQNMKYLIYSLQQIKAFPPPIIDKMAQSVNKRIPQMIQLYELQKCALNYRNSKNLFYLQMLLYDTKLHYRNEREIIMNQCPQNNKASTDPWFIYPKIKSFQKIINIDRSNFTQEDHIFLLPLDVYQLKNQKAEKANQQILNYLIKKKELIISIFTIENTQERTYILTAFSIFLYILSKQKELKIINQVLEFIYPIVQKKLSIQRQTQLNHFLTKCFVRLGKFKQIFNEIIDCSRFYTDHISNSNLISISRLYFNTIKMVIEYNQEELFYQQLKVVIQTIDLKKIPVFGIFLLFCIRPFNRMAILKLITHSLQHVKYHGKYLILSRYYKEFLKLKSVSFLNKKKNILRKDSCYPSTEMLNLQELKKRFDCETALSMFTGLNQQILEQKIIKFGQCCQVYSTTKVPHPFNEIVDFSILNKSDFKNDLQEWKSSDFRFMTNN